MPEVPSLEGIQGLRKQAYEKSGVSEKPYEDFLADLKAQKEELKGKGKEEAMGNFLAQLGFGMAAGKSPYAMQNIGEAGVPAAKALAADLKDLDNKSDKIAERQFAVLDAQNKFRQTGADSDLKTLTDKQNSFESAKRDYATTNANLASNQATRDDAVTHLKVTEAGADARATLAARLQARGLEIQAFSANTQRLAEQKPELFNTILDNLERDPKYTGALKKGDSDTANKMITSAISDAKSISSGAGSKGFTHLNSILAEFQTGSGPLATEYNKIYKAKGLAEAEKFKEQYISKAARDAGIQYGGTSVTGNVLQYDPASGTLK